MIAINLVPRRLRDTAAVRSRTRRWIAFGAVYAAALSITCIALRSFGGEQTSRLENDGGQLAARVASAEQALDRLRKDVQEQNRRLEASETVGVHPDWSTFLAAAADLREEDIILQHLEIRASDAERAPAAKAKDDGEKPKARSRQLESYLVTLKGYGLAQTDVMGFIRRLEDLGPLVDVQLKESRAQPFRGVSAVAFDAECRLVETAPRQGVAGGTP